MSSLDYLSITFWFYGLPDTLTLILCDFTMDISERKLEMYLKIKCVEYHIL